MSVGTLSSCGKVADSSNSSTITEQHGAENKTVGIRWENKSYARLTFKLDSSWDEELLYDGRYLYYPPVSEPTGFIQCFWYDSQIGIMSDEDAQTVLDAGVSGVQSKFKNVEEINHTYYKVGDKNAVRVSYYHDNVATDVNNDKRGITDMVVVLFDDGFSMLTALFTESEYKQSYTRIIETALDSVELGEETKDSTSNETQATTNANTPINGIRPEFKVAMDSYEEFFSKYVEFMTSNNPSDNFGEYTEFMTQYAETMSKMEDIDTEILSDEEMAYYLEVTNRITTMLLGVVQ